MSEWTGRVTGPSDTGIVGPIKIYGTRPWSEVKDDLFGAPGTPRREEIEAGARALERRDRIAKRLTGWLDVFGPVGHTASVFWFWVLTEGNPRDGMEWSFLNDAMGRPRLWHTWSQMRGNSEGLYPSGVPERRPESAP